MDKLDVQFVHKIGLLNASTLSAIFDGLTCARYLTMIRKSIDELPNAM